MLCRAAPRCAALCCALQVAGYVVEYDSGLSYATVKGAGHMVPGTNPREALDMFSRFISGQSLTGRRAAATGGIAAEQGTATS